MALSLHVLDPVSARSRLTELKRSKRKRHPFSLRTRGCVFGCPRQPPSRLLSPRGTLVTDSATSRPRRHHARRGPLQRTSTTHSANFRAPSDPLLINSRFSSCDSTRGKRIINAAEWVIPAAQNKGCAALLQNRALNGSLRPRVGAAVSLAKC